MKRIFLGTLILAVLASGWFLVLQLTTPEVAPTSLRTPPAPRLSSTASSASSASTSGVSAQPVPAEPVKLERLDLAKDLNAPEKTAREDLQLLDSVFSVWQSNFLKEGNPVGDNAEITAALTGKNSLHVAFIAPDHPAINAKGELCDRWGTPFFFHQQSGFRMGITSAGPDHIRGTADDVVFAPPP